jgi:hypothetical protein
MEPFNIKINTQNESVVLTVLPTDKGFFKLIYYGAVLVGLKKEAKNNWVLISNEDMEVGDLPYYIAGASDDHVKIILDEAFEAEAGAAIDDQLALQR